MLSSFKVTVVKQDCNSHGVTVYCDSQLPYTVTGSLASAELEEFTHVRAYFLCSGLSVPKSQPGKCGLTLK